MRAGTINRRLTVEAPEATQNETGEEIISWTLVGTVWAQMEPLRSREALISGTNLAIADTKIRIRWSPTMGAVNEKWRALYRNTVYNIVSVAHLNIGKREIELLCKSGSNEG